MWDTAKPGVDTIVRRSIAGYDWSALLGGRSDHWYAQTSLNRRGVDHWDLSDAFKPTATENGGHRNLSQTSDTSANAKIGYTPTGWNFWTHGFGIEPYEGPASVMVRWPNRLSGRRPTWPGEPAILILPLHWIVS